MPTLSSNNALMVLIGSFVVIGAVLVAVLVAQALLQRRRLSRTTAHFAGRLLAAHDEERASLARELHDDIIHRLVRLLSAARLRRPEESEEIELEELVGDLRQLARGMHPAVLDHLDFEQCLESLVAATRERQEVEVTLAFDPRAVDVSEHQKRHLFRVAQEAVGNALRHSGCTSIVITVMHATTEVTLTVQDNGRGFAPRRADAQQGLGLTSMRERLGLCRGSLHLKSVAGEGTTIMARVPVQAGE